MKPRESISSVLAISCLALLILALVGATPTASTAFAETSGTNPLPADSSMDTATGAVDGDDSEEESIIDVLMDVLNAVL